MWDVMVDVAQSSALHWTVVGGAMAALVYKLFTSNDQPLMGDLLGDDNDI
jgi:hypothetical protein